MNNIAIFRRKFAEMPVVCTIAVNDNVKKVKLKINPTITPSGWNLPLDVPAARTAGKIGRIQGERIVTIPAKNAKANRTSIYCVSLFLGQNSFFNRKVELGQDKIINLLEINLKLAINY